MKFKRAFSLFMTGIMLSTVFPRNVFAEDIIHNSNSSVEDDTVSGSSISVTSNDIDVDFNLTGQWNGGFNGEIVITNTGDSKIENWQIEMTFPQEITNIWNAAIESHEGTVYNIRNAGGNNNVDIPIGESVTFGFSGTYTDEIVEPTNVKLITGRQTATAEDYSIDYQLMSDWGSGFTAQIVITNNTDKPMEAWHLEFDYAGEISNMWNGMIEKTENSRYYISNADYNSVIPANGSVTIGFNGVPDNEHSEPSDFELYYFGNEKNSTQIEQEEENIIDEVDTDGDGVYDYIEEYFGSDINLEDTDGDGLSDYIEIFVIGTDPTMVDTDENGVDDGDEDAEQDGLTNIKEVNLGTNLISDDTDLDGLSDFDEVNKYHTDPTVADTDKDGLEDGDDVLLGFDPNKYDTDGNGVKDGDEKVEQTLHQKIDCEELPGITDVNVTLSVSGNINNVVTAKDMYNVNTFSSDLVGITGAPIDFTSAQEFDSAKVSFVYDESKLNIAPEKLGILWYDEENQFYEVMETTLDEQNHCISMTTPHFSEYTVVDMEKWFAAWEEDFNKKYSDGSSVTKNNEWQGEVATVNELVERFKSKFNTTVDMMNLVLPYCEEGDVYCQFGTFEFELTNGDTAKYNCIYMSHGEFNTVSKFTSSNGTAFVSPSNGMVAYYTNYDVSKLNLTIDEIAPPNSMVKACRYDQSDKFFLPSGQVDDTDDDGDDLFDIYELTGMRIANGNVIYTDTETENKKGYDTDGDGLKDGDEIERFDSERGYFKLKSYPGCKDSDFDFIPDYIDSLPYNNNFVGVLNSSHDTSFIDFNVNYNDFLDDSSIYNYNKNISALSVIMSTLAYDKSYLKITDANCDNYLQENSVKDLLEFFGFNNVENYSLDEIFNPDTFFLDEMKKLDRFEERNIHLSEVTIGHRTISNNAKKKEIVAVVIRGTNGTLEEWSSNFYIGDVSEYGNLEYWNNIKNHAGFDIPANKILDIIYNYIETYGIDKENVLFWVTGHSRGAAIANIIGANLSDAGYLNRTYTFATPNTTLSDSVGDKKYFSIFNVINEDDFVPDLPSDKWGYSKYGKISQDVSISKKFEIEWNNQTGSPYNYNFQKNNLSDSLANIISGKNPQSECYKIIYVDDYKVTYTNKISEKIPVNTYYYFDINMYKNNENVLIIDFYQSPQYFMQLIASIMSGQTKCFPKLAPHFEDVESKFIIAGVWTCFTDNLAIPHYPDAYYLISQNIDDGDFN